MAWLSDDEVHRHGGTVDLETASELSELLAGLGVEEEQATIVGYLAAHGEGRSRAIENHCKLRQPQVSQATNELEERGWIETDHEKTPGKGRPVNVYSLGLHLEDIVEEVTARRREEVNRELARIERLRQLIRDLSSKQPEAASPDRTRAEHPEGQG